MNCLGFFWEINSTSQSFCISTWLSLKLLLKMWKITLQSSCKDPVFNKCNICLFCTTEQGKSFHLFWSIFPSKHVTKWFYYIIRFLLYKQHFIRNPRLKLTKNQANAKQHTEAEFLQFEYYSHSSTLSFKKW